MDNGIRARSVGALMLLSILTCAPTVGKEKRESALHLVLATHIEACRDSVSSPYILSAEFQESCSTIIEGSGGSWIPPESLNDSMKKATFIRSNWKIWGAKLVITIRHRGDAFSPQHDYHLRLRKESWEVEEVTDYLKVFSCFECE